MIPAFWDASAVVPLCADQTSTATARRLLQQYGLVAWWSTPVEIRSALERLLRMGQVTPAQHAAAGHQLQRLRQGWREVQPADQIRTQAEDFLVKYSLRAADALQLAAAWSWCSAAPRDRAFISADKQLLNAAQQVGFQTIAT